MSVLEQIRKLDEQKAQLIGAAKEEALGVINTALKGLSALGFHYKLVPHDEPVQSSTGRRNGIRALVLDFIKDQPGITRAQILEKLNSRGNKSAEQSVSNALSVLKKDGAVDVADGRYRAK